MISTPKEKQQAIIRHFNLELDSNGVKPTKSSRGGPHIRFSYTGDFKRLLNSLTKCEIKESDVSVSGSYVTYELTLKEPIKGANKGDSCYLVIATSSKGVLKTKQLTPNKLKIAGKKIAAASYVKLVLDGIEKLVVPENIKQFLKEKFQISKKDSAKFSDKFITAISDTDLNIIAKDFGEIAGGYFMLKQLGGTHIEFPADEASPLVDYHIYVGNKKIAVSAKANDGAPPSIDAIADILRKSKYTNKAKESARKAIISISDNSTVDGIVKASKDLQTPGYVWLKSNVFGKKDFEAKDCETVLSSFKDGKTILDRLSGFYQASGRSASAEITNRIIATNAKRWGLIISPLGYHLVDVLNTNSTYLDVLNDAAKSIVVTQVYVKINKSQRSINYTVKEFTSSAFSFMYNANAGQPSLKKISFKMDKKK